MGAKDSTEDIVAKASMEEAALWARAEWEALRAEVAFRAEVPVMLEGAVTLEEALRVEVAFMVEAGAAAMLEAVALAVEAAAMPVVAGAAAVTTEHVNSARTSGQRERSATRRSAFRIFRELPVLPKKFRGALHFFISIQATSRIQLR
jgi:hypothetical protein